MYSELCTQCTVFSALYTVLSAQCIVKSVQPCPPSDDQKNQGANLSLPSLRNQKCSVQCVCSLYNAVCSVQYFVLCKKYSTG